MTSLTAGSKISFARNNAGTLLFEAMRKAGLLASFTDEATGEQRWGMERGSGIIDAKITDYGGLLSVEHRLSTEEWAQFARRS